jgi:hypothetical protein
MRQRTGYGAPLWAFLVRIAILSLTFSEARKAKPQFHPLAQVRVFAPPRSHDGWSRILEEINANVSRRLIAAPGGRGRGPNNSF